MGVIQLQAKVESRGPNLNEIANINKLIYLSII